MLKKYLISVCTLMLLLFGGSAPLKAKAAEVPAPACNVGQLKYVEGICSSYLLFSPAKESHALDIQLFEIEENDNQEDDDEESSFRRSVKASIYAAFLFSKYEQDFIASTNKFASSRHFSQDASLRYLVLGVFRI